MTADTIRLEIRKILLSNTEYLYIIKGESFRMPETIYYLCRILPYNAVRNMTVITGYIPVTRNAPTVEAIAHNVAIRAGNRIIKKIRVTHPIPKCISTCSE